MATQTERGWHHFPHEADVGVCGLGPDPAAAFEQAAIAMMAVITDPVRVRPRTAVTVQCAAPSLELLLVEWLNALVFEMATRRMLFGAFSVEIEDTNLRGEARGEPVDRARHAPGAEVKGATYTCLAVSRDAPGHWSAQCVLDV